MEGGQGESPIPAPLKTYKLNIHTATFCSEELVIRSEDFGVPQARHRVILLGIEVSQSPKFSGPMNKTLKQLHTKDVLSDLPVIRSGLTPASADSSEAWARLIREASLKIKKEFSKIDLVNSGLEEYARKAGKIKSRGAPFIRRTKNFSESNSLKTWFEDERLPGFTNHMSRGHKPEDLVRYFFCSSYALQNDGASAKASDFPESLTPNHKNWRSGIFVDRFKVQQKVGVQVQLQAISQRMATITSTMIRPSAEVSR